MIGAGRGPSDRAMWCLPGRADLPWCAAAGAQLPGHWIRFGPLCRMIGAGRGPSDRASFIQRGESERAKWCLPGGADLPWCAAAGAQLPGHWSRFGPLCRMIAAGRGPSDRAMWCLPGGADLPWCAAAGAQVPGHWIRFGASLPHGRRRERPVGPGQFHSERRISSGPPLCRGRRRERPSDPGRCGFAMVRRSGGATARPLESIWASLPHDRRRERPVGPGQFHSERRIRAGRVVPPGRCGFAMVRRSGGAPARPLDSIWSLSVAWSPLLSTGPIAGQQQRLRTGIEPPR